jgi:hypothetical protein
LNRLANAKPNRTWAVFDSSDRTSSRKSIT